MSTPLICPQCGGRINPYTNECEYCKTKFKPEHEPDVIVRYDNPQRCYLLGAKIKYPIAYKYSLDAKIDFESHMKLKLAEKFLPELISKYIEFTEDYDIDSNSRCLVGKLKVAKMRDDNENKQTTTFRGFW